ncbi:hypothetical protein CerSpe_116310 [Prunus speciosa]
MHPILLSPILNLLLLLFFFYSLDATPSFWPNKETQETQTKETPSVCSQTFACGPLQGLSYPFTGGARSGHCGPPEFHISCVDDSPELTIMSLRYQILELNPVHKNLRLVRSDLWNSTCTDKLANVTIKSEFFASNENDDTEVSIFYGCNSSTITPKPENWFPCNVNLPFNDSYYLIGTFPIHPIMGMSTVRLKLQCRFSRPRLRSSVPIGRCFRKRSWKALMLTIPTLMMMNALNVLMEKGAVGLTPIRAGPFAFVGIGFATYQVPYSIVYVLEV